MVKDLSLWLRLNEKLGNYSVFNDSTSGKLVFLLVDVSQYVAFSCGTVFSDYKTTDNGCRSAVN